MSTPDGTDRPGDDPTPPPWDAPPQPPAWDRPAGPPGSPWAQQPGGQGYGAAPYGQGYAGPPPGYGGPAWGPPPGYGGYGYAPPTTDGKAVTALVMSILSFVLCPVVPAIIALVLASSSQRAIDASAGRLGGDGLNKAAKIISWINLALVGLVVAGFVLLIALVPGSFEATTTGTVT